MENEQNQTTENEIENPSNELLNNEEPMEKDDIVNPDQFQVGRTTEHEPEQQDDSEYTPEENQFADGKGSELAQEFDDPDPEEVDDDEDDVLEDDVEIDDDKDQNQQLN